MVPHREIGVLFPRVEGKACWVGTNSPHSSILSYQNVSSWGRIGPLIFVSPAPGRYLYMMILGNRGRETGMKRFIHLAFRSLDLQFTLSSRTCLSLDQSFSGLLWFLLFVPLS